MFGHSRIVEKNRLIFTFVILGALMQFIAGCGSQSEVPLSAIKANAQSFVKDYKGNIHYFTKRPVRIISLYVSSDEIILDLVAPDRILALSEWAHDREISNVVEKAKIVPIKAIANLEFISAMKPDLVLMRCIVSDDMMRSIQDLGIPVYAYNNLASIEEVQKMIGDLAFIVGERERGAAMLDKMNSELKEVKTHIGKVAETQKQTAMLFFGGNAIGVKGSIFDTIANYAQVNNGAARVNMIGGSTTQSIPKESIIEINPDVLLVAEWTFGGKNTSVLQMIKEIGEDQSLQLVNAVKNKRIKPIPVRYTHCMSQYVPAAILAVHDAVYKSDGKN